MLSCMGEKRENKPSSAGEIQVPISSVSMHMNKKQGSNQTGKPVPCHTLYCTESHPH